MTAVYFGAKAAMAFGRDVRGAIFHRVMSFSARELNSFGAPSLITRNTNDVQQVQMLVLMSCTVLLSAPITMIGGIVMAIRQDAGLSWLVAVAVPLLAGAVAGMGGAFYTLVSVPQFNREMTGGAGYIALAAVIFGKWDPVRATLAALLFGFASNLQGVLAVLGSPVPSQFMLMLPYVITIFAVAGLVGRSRAPAADGVAYTKE